MILILTNSYDVTSDVLVNYIGTEHVFRFNVDKWSDYAIEININSFIIVDVIGRSICEQDVSHLYWRKPFSSQSEKFQIGSLEFWLASQRSYVLRELCNILIRKRVPALVEPFAERRVGKVIQMREASRWFTVPQWVIWQGKNPSITKEGEWVVKSLIMDPLGKNQFLYTTSVDNHTLDPQYLWFSQRLIKSEYDVTVVYIRGKCHAYQLRKPPNKVIDWRCYMDEPQEWERIPWNTDLMDRTKGLMNTLKLTFGRIDFVKTVNNTLYFLEVNPNGQFAWLDSKGDDGLIDDIVKELIV